MRDVPTLPRSSRCGPPTSKPARSKSSSLLAPARTWVALTLFAIAWLAAPGLAHADPFGVVTVDLRPINGDVPTHVCVASRAKGPRTRTTLDRLIDVPGVTRDTTDVSTHPVPSESSTELDYARSTRPTNPSDAGTGELRLSGSTWGESADSGRCSGGDGPCAPRIRTAGSRESLSELHVACTSDALIDARGVDPRVLVLLAEHLEGSPPRIESLNLAGGVLTIGVEADLTKVVVTTRSLGGHYLPDERSFRAEARGREGALLVLPVTPRCMRHEFELPGVRLRASDQERLHVEAHGEPVDVGRCVGSLRGTSRLTVELPIAADRNGSLSIRVDPRADGLEGGRFGLHWTAPWPEPGAVLAIEQVSFLWRPPACIFPDDECPVASMEGGIACAAKREGSVCQYVCPGDDDQVDVRLPIEVTFEKDYPTQRWTDTLQRPGQELVSYVPSDDVHLRADLSTWVTDTPGSRITHVEVQGNDGVVRRYGAGGVRELVVRVPGATCEPVRFKLVGDRDFREARASVVDGRLEFGAIERTVVPVSFNFTLLAGGGPTFGDGLADLGGPNVDVRTPVFFTGLAMLAAEFRARKPALARFAGEIRLGATAGQWGFFGTDTVSEPVRRVRPQIAWVRFLAEPAFVVNLTDGVRLTTGLGIGSAWPARPSLVRDTDTFRAILSPSIDVRVRVRPRIHFVAQTRGFFRESLSAYETDTSGQVQRRTFDAYSLDALLGVQLDL